MPFWSICDSYRSQTEPIAALFAVVLVAIAITMYSGVLMELLPGQSERAPTAVTSERIWGEIESDGVYDLGTLSNPSAAVKSSVLPRGFNVYVNVTYLADSGWKADDGAIYTPDGSAYDTDPGEPPERADVFVRPIPVRTSPGVVESGRLYVAVWER